MDIQIVDGWVTIVMPQAEAADLSGEILWVKGTQDEDDRPALGKLERALWEVLPGNTRNEAPTP